MARHTEGLHTEVVCYTNDDVSQFQPEATNTPKIYLFGANGKRYIVESTRSMARWVKEKYGADASVEIPRERMEAVLKERGVVRLVLSFDGAERA